jgi:hypothetical protein
VDSRFFLNAEGFVHREVYAVVPPKVEYSVGPRLYSLMSSTLGKRWSGLVSVRGVESSAATFLPPFQVP